MVVMGVRGLLWKVKYVGKEGVTHDLQKNILGRDNLMLKV